MKQLSGTGEYPHIFDSFVRSIASAMRLFQDVG
jgi:hypothetical protein